MMANIKGAKQFQKFKDGKLLTRKEALLAECYECNCFEAEDCLGISCPLYQHSPYNKSLKYRILDKQKPYPKALVEANRRRREEKN
jgi:hypothetical protein